MKSPIKKMSRLRRRYEVGKGVIEKCMEPMRTWVPPEAWKIKALKNGGYIITPTKRFYRKKESPV